MPVRRSARPAALDRNDRDSKIVLSAGKRELDTVTLIEHIKISVDEAGNATLGAGDLTLVDSETNTAIAMHRFEPGLVAPPSNCTERALVRFGPLPWNMPPLNFPEIESCSSSRCTTITEGWIRGHHNVWRVTQMFAFLATQGSAQRSYYWKRPATDAFGEGVGGDGSDTSFAYTFGRYTDERYYAVREGFYFLMDIFLKSKTLASKIHLKCGSCGGYGKHTTIGWPNVCSGAFNDSAGLYDDNQDAVTHTVMHELMHWLFIEIDAGPRALRDTVTHAHGRWCTSGLTTTYVDSISEVRDFATYNASDDGTCWHRSKAVQIIESYTNMAMRIGEGVKDGELVYWPELAEPTPQPPVCVGTEGCLCSELLGENPDGNHSIDQYCDDNDGEATCVRTAVNAGAIVGICTKCDPVRGPGCECDAQLPCDEGSCWGDDTYGGGVGHCYDDDPPSWVCLADCEQLFNQTNAECINTHIGGARCVDSDCPQYISEECYSLSMVCREGNCIVECTSVQDCADRGYPASFECVANRCEFPF